MSVYSELLRMVLDHDDAVGDRPLADLIGDLLAQRATVLAVTGTGSRPGGPADRIGDTLSYDVALVRLCHHLSIDHGLDGDAPIPALRRRAEERVAARLPSIAHSLGAAQTDDAGSERASDHDPGSRANRPDPRQEP